VAHYRERFTRILDRAAGGVQELGRRLGGWLERFQSSAPGESESEFDGDDDFDEGDEPVGDMD